MTSGKAIQLWRSEVKKCSQWARLSLLKKWAELKVKRRNDNRTLQEMRAAANRSTPPRDRDGPCWCCHLFRPLFRHHVIQLQHGGTNYHLNIVRICWDCHAKIHPWLQRNPF